MCVYAFSPLTNARHLNDQPTSLLKCNYTTWYMFISIYVWICIFTCIFRVFVCADPKTKWKSKQMDIYYDRTEFYLCLIIIIILRPHSANSIGKNVYLVRWYYIMLYAAVPFTASLRFSPGSFGFYYWWMMMFVPCLSFSFPFLSPLLLFTHSFPTTLTHLFEENLFGKKHLFSSKWKDSKEYCHHADIFFIGHKKYQVLVRLATIIMAELFQASPTGQKLPRNYWKRTFIKKKIQIKNNEINTSCLAATVCLLY